MNLRDWWKVRTGVSPIYLGDSRVRFNNSRLQPWPEWDPLLLRRLYEGRPIDDGLMPKVTPLQLQQFARREYVLRMARIDPNVFMSYAMTDNQGLALLQSQIHEEWHAAIQDHDRVLIEAPRDHGKTTQLSVGVPIWFLGIDPKLRIKLITQADDKAIKIMTEISDNIEHNPKIRDVFPNLVPDDTREWSKHTLTVKRPIMSKDPSLEVLGILSTATGGRADILFFDDVVDYRNAIQNPSLRKVIKETFFSVFVNLLEPGGRIIVVGTPWTTDDLYAHLEKLPGYYVLKHSVSKDFDHLVRTGTEPVRKVMVDGAEVSDGGKVPLWKEKWSPAELKKRAAEIGDREFARQFRNQALSPEEQLFGIDQLMKCFVEPDTMPSEFARIYAGVDLGLRLTAKSTWTVIFLWGVDNKGYRWPVEIIRVKFKAGEIINALIGLFMKYRGLIEVLCIENNAAQQMLLDWIEELWSDNKEVQTLLDEIREALRAHTTGKNKMDPQMGLPGYALDFSNTIVKIPVGKAGHDLDSCTCILCKWLTEMKNWPLGESTDMLMASWIAREGIRKAGMGGNYDSWDVTEQSGEEPKDSTPSGYQLW